ncbi:MAG: hypothetical protein Q8M29_19840 [Bacteroidota bacterium]|nr:hypothetical protein [Bacteroidota bacterium]
MKLILCLVAIFYFSEGNCQFLMPKKDSTLKVINDTTFILREFQGESKIYHAIYIEKSSKAKKSKWLMDFIFDKSDKEALLENLKSQKEEAAVKKLKKHNLQGLPKNWLPVYQYHKNYYLYAPSDWGNAGKRILSDSLLINWYMDGPYPELLQSVTKENASTFVIKYKDNEEGKEDQTLVIHIIDPKIKLAVWEYPSNDGGPAYYRLYIPVAAAPNFDMVVNHCELQKQMEFKFDEIDFKKLLKFK